VNHAPKTLNEILTRAVWLEFSEGAKAAEMYLMKVIDEQDIPEIREAVEEAILKSKTPSLSPDA
jgi:hypothetical protein